MKAVVVNVDGGVVLKDDHPTPSPGEGEALVKVIRAGICNTDLEVIKGYMGFTGVLGHEVLGRVEEVEDNDQISVGDRVVAEINLTCGKCHICDQGGIAKRNHCADRTVLGILLKDGVFCEYVTLPIENLHKVPENLTDQVAVFAEPLAAGFRIAEQIPYKEGDSIAIIGDGKLGQCCADVIRLEAEKYNFREILLIGRHEEKLALAEKPVTTHVSCDATGDTYRDKFDVVVEASGSPSGVMLAASITRPLGTIILKTTCAADATSFNTAPFVIKELNIIGSRCGNFPMALDAMATGKIKMEKLLTKVYPFSEAVEAIQHAGTKGTLKIQLVMEGEGS